MCSEMNSEQPAGDSRTDHTHATGVAQSRIMIDSNISNICSQELSKLGVRYVAVDLTQNPSTFEQIKDAGFKQIPVVISPNSSWSGHRPDLIRQLAQSIAA